MNSNFKNFIQFPHKSTLFCVGEKVFDRDWNEHEVKLRKGWRYVVISRQQIGVSSLEDRTGYSEPIYFNYVFGGGFMNGDNFYYDQFLNLNNMKPRQSYNIYDDEWEEFESIENDFWTEDDQMERERDLKEGQDIKDEYDNEDADDLRNINIG